MGEPIDRASSGPASDMDPPTEVLNGPIGLAGAGSSGRQNAKVTKKMYKQHVSSEEEKEEEKQQEEEDDDDDQGGKEKERTKGRVFPDLFKYRGCSWPGVVGLKVHKAKRIISKGKPDIYIQVVSKNQFLTMCYCPTRVRLKVDSSNCVVEIPTIG